MTIEVNVKRQELILFENNKILGKYKVSSSRFGLGFDKGSNKTPTGNFSIYRKIGKDQPINTIFKNRVVVGVWNGEKPDRELITTRIIWLTGEDDFSKNTRERYIYIHGTNEEDKIGSPASHGCIRMLNKDIINLFDLIREGDPVIINER